MSSKKGGGRQYSGGAPSMRGPAKKKAAGKKESAAATTGRVRPQRAQNAFSYDNSDWDREGASAGHRYDADAAASREYALPSNFEDEDLDSDEEGIFDEKDEEQYGESFAKLGKGKGKKPVAKGKAGKASHASTEDEEFSGEEDEEEDLDGFEGAETMNLSDMIGMDLPEDEEDEAPPAKKGAKKAPLVKLTKAQQKMLLDEADEEEDEEDEPMDDKYDDEDDDEQMEFDDDEDDEDEDTGNDAHKNLLKMVQGMANSDVAAAPVERKQRGGKRPTNERTEVFDEDQFSIPRVAGETTSMSSGLKLSDLVRKLPGVATGSGSERVGDSASVAALKKQFTVLQNEHTKTLVEPMAQIRQEEMERQAGYKMTKEEIAKWNATINRHRDMPTVTYPLNAPGRQNTSSAELVTKFVAGSDLETDFKTLLDTYGMKENQLKDSESRELAQRNYTAEEIEKREGQVAKMKALLFHQELKQKRVNKIKSKNYRRLQKKIREKGKLTLEEMKTLDPDAYEAEQRKAEAKRIEERMSLQHSSSSKWMKHQLRMNEQMKGQNTELKESLKTHAATAAALKAKQESFPKQLNSEGEEESSDSEEEDDQFAESDEEDDSQDEGGQLKAQRASESRASTIRAKLRELENELGEADEAEPADGFDQAPGTTKSSGKAAAAGKGERILGLKFMQKAAEKKREETRAMIRAYEAELDQELKRDELRRQNRREGKDELDEDELDALVAASGTSMDGVDAKQPIIIGRKKVDAKTAAKITLVTGVGEDKIKLLPNSLQTASVGKGAKSRVDGPIAVAAPKTSAASAAAAAALKTKNDHPGQHSSVHGKSSVSVDTPFVSKSESEKLFPTEEFSEDEEEAETKQASSVNTKLIDLVKIRHDSRATVQAAKKAAKKAATVVVAAAEASEDEDLEVDGEAKEEANPWAAGSTANPRKALRDTELSARTKKKQKTEKNKSVAVFQAQEDEEDEEQDGGIDADLSGPLALQARRSEFDLLAAGSLTQAELVKRAFSTAEEDTLMVEGDDGLEDEFEKLKREAMEEDLPKEEKSVLGLPGWGSWGGIGAVQRKSAGQLAREAAEKKSRDAKRLAALSSRRDAKLKHVLINEKVDQKALKYQVATLPYPFTSQEQYEKSLAVPVGKEWNTTLAFQQNVRPRVITKAGEIIDPVKYNAKVGAGPKKKGGAEAKVKDLPKKISGGAPASGQKRKR